MRALSLLMVATTLLGCKTIPLANEPFREALTTVYRAFEADDATKSASMQVLEEQLYRELDVASRAHADRSIVPDRLTEADLGGVAPRPDRDPELAGGLAASGLSPHPVREHARIPLLPDQRVVEPQSPDHYDRAWIEGEGCWATRDCLWLRTRQDLTKNYPGTQPITYAFHKDYRWVDLAPDEDEPRWAIIARSWNDDTYSSANGASTLWQAFTLELWLPRDGRGFRWIDVDPADRPDDADSRADTTPEDSEGTLRVMVLWSEAQIGGIATLLTEDQEHATIRIGTDQTFNAQDKWLADNPR